MSDCLEYQKYNCWTFRFNRNSSYNGNTHTNRDNPENQRNSLKHLKYALPNKQSKLLYSLFVLLLVNKIIWSLVNPSNLSQSSAISSWPVFIIIRLHLPRKSPSTNWRSSSLTRDQHLAPDLMEPGWKASWCFTKVKIFLEKCGTFSVLIWSSVSLFLRRNLPPEKIFTRRLSKHRPVFTSTHLVCLAAALNLHEKNQIWKPLKIDYVLLLIRSTHWE